ncbi:unnamed protein product [Microthlaspi erraticum]|uniref:Calmodulin-binding domain-containing protein n=1 Tax=Microthlaspi erraticum TaxID=1685480 RepID=A0A6D2J2B9_9BRAS|nr:unnamed protein product [Microthlaspi erraticum]
MSTPMFTESSSKNSRRVHKRRERKLWKKPIRISRLPSFGFSGSDFTVDQIPAIFSGYTAELEDSSSPEMSDGSRTYSNETEEVDQESSKSVRRILEPHYLRPTSSSASKKMEKIQKNLEVVRLKRMSSLKYNGLLKATCSSAMKGSKKSNDVCNYNYCSLHGRPHSHAADNNSVVGVPSLKRFVSMRRKVLKRQKSVNRRLVLLKRTLSRKRLPLGGGTVTDQEPNQEVSEEEVYTSENGGSDSESNGRSSETVMVDVAGEEDRGKDSKETVPSAKEHDDGNVSAGEMREEDGKKTENVWNDEESKQEIMDDSNGRIGKEFKESNVEDKKREETVEDNEEVCREEDGKKTENVWNDTVMLVKQAFDEILAEISDDDDSSDDVSVTKKDDDVGADSSDSTSSDLQPVEERDTYLSVIVSTSLMGEESDHRRGGAKKWSFLKRVILLKRFLKSLDGRERRKLSDGEESEKMIMRLRRELVGERKIAEEWMLDHALRQVVSTLVPSQKRKVKHLVKAFESLIPVNGKQEEEEVDTSLNNVETSEEGTLKVEEDCEVNKDEQRIRNVFSKVHQKGLKGGEEEVDSTPRKSRSVLPPIENVKQRTVVEKEKESRMWKLIYKHMVTEKEEGNGESVEVEGEGDDARRSGTVTLVREALEKILSEIPDNSPDDQSIDSNITTDQELFSQETLKAKSNEKRVKGWNNVKKVILLKRFVSDLGSLSRLSGETPQVLPWEHDPETEKIRLRRQEVGGKRNSEEWMLDYALRQAISTLPPSQKRKVTLLAQAFDTISLQDIGSCSSTPGSAASSRNISRQSSYSSTAFHIDNESSNAEIIRGKLRNLQETTKVDLEEKQQCSGLWRLLCKQMEDNERNQTLPEETREEEQEQEEELKEDTNVDGEKMELYKTEAVELLGEVIDGISLEEACQEQKKNESLRVSQVRINRWYNLKRVILLRRFVKALENVRKFNPKEPRFLPLEPGFEAEKVNLRHQETQNKRNLEEWMVDNTLQEVVSKLTPARKLKVQLLVQAFETLSATEN